MFNLRHDISSIFGLQLAVTRFLFVFKIKYCIFFPSRVIDRQPDHAVPTRL